MAKARSKQYSPTTVKARVRVAERQLTLLAQEYSPADVARKAGHSRLLWADYHRPVISDDILQTFADDARAGDDHERKNFCGSLKSVVWGVWIQDDLVKKGRDRKQSNETSSAGGARAQ
jgi:hypothetical protein